MENSFYMKDLKFTNAECATYMHYTYAHDQKNTTSGYAFTYKKSAPHTMLQHFTYL